MSEEYLKEIREIRKEIEDILQRHGRFMSTKGANLYWAMQKLESAIGYLNDEEEMVSKLSR